ncbi:hypothetical protein AXG93_3022s1070 [Marchantia polymorpha subsp. ruderalis]|uniref:DDE-1 domain-containing protein n=1 Tax=Marchantia polymorpha subsp. ruderalis TaxID=1480154 RepID=A0A176VEJ0_MARPO|nr:hypothetical protein AXG93_3022s1070 [Marchantia polymorpha subsp. ruderalis]
MTHAELISWVEKHLDMKADNSLAPKQLEGRKAQKERITLAICSNGDGSDKLPLWIIGKFWDPRCFRNLNGENLGCRYRWNLKAWMTQVIFLEWIKWFDLRMAERKVLLILDNCSAHIRVNNLLELRNTTVRYLSSNTTSKIQPCDAGIIWNLKAYYHRRFNEKILMSLDSNISYPEKIDILEGYQMAVAAWTLDVKPETISNCFHHCQICSKYTRLPRVTKDMVEPAAEVISELESQIRRFCYENPMNIRNLLNYPDEEVVTYKPSDEDIIAILKEPAVEIPGHEEEDDNEELPKICLDDAIFMLENLQHFWLQQEGVHTENLLSIRSMMDDACRI